MQKNFKEKRLGIIGGKGKMARHFLRYFRSEFKSIHIFDTSSKVSLGAFCKKCDVILIAVPISQTRDIIYSLKDYVKAHHLVLDFCSLKEEVCKALKKLPCQTMGMHPLYGPNASCLEKLKIALCPVTIEEGQMLVEKLFRKKKIQTFVVDPQIHDQLMAHIQALNHMSILSMAPSTQLLPMSLLEKLSTPSFERMKQALKTILQDNPALYRSIAFENPYFLKTLEKYQKEVLKIYKIVKEKDSKAFDRIFNTQKKRWIGK